MLNEVVKLCQSLFSRILQEEEKKAKSVQIKNTTDVTTKDVNVQKDQAAFIHVLSSLMS